jgi:multiple sugar transport system substrate-binding protein
MQRESGSAARPPDPPRCYPVPITLLSLALALPVAGLACGSRTPSTEQSAPAAPPMLKVACPTPRLAEIVQRYGRPWASRQGLQLETVPYDATNDSARNPGADLWVVQAARMPHWAAAGTVLPVPETLIGPASAYDWEGQLTLYRNTLLRWGRKTFALPLLGDSSVCFYRSDLFNDDGHRQAFQKRYGRALAPPDTWQEFAQVAEYFHNQPRPGINHPCASLTALPTDDDGLDRLFYSVAASFAHAAVREDDPKPPSPIEQFSFHYDLGDGTIRIATSGFVEALKLLQRLQAFRPAQPSTDPLASFINGEAVLSLAPVDAISRFKQKLRGRFGVRRLPGSSQVFGYRTGQARSIAGGNFVPYLGADAWVLVVPQTSTQPDAAFGLAAALSDPRTSGDIVIEPAWGGGVVRRQQLTNRQGWQAFDLTPALTTSLLESLQETLMHAQITNPVIRLRIPDERSHRQALDAELRAALLHGKRAEDALQQAAARWRQLDAGKDLKVRVRDYRLSLSLGD